MLSGSCPLRSIAVHFDAKGSAAHPFLKQGPLLGGTRELRLGSGNLVKDLCSYLRTLRRETMPGEILNVVIPETVTSVRPPYLPYILRRRRLQRLKAALLAEPDVVVTNVTRHRGYEVLEPGEEAARRPQTEGAGDIWPCCSGTSTTRPLRACATRRH
jgi:hypothetical protein